MKIVLTAAGAALLLSGLFGSPVHAQNVKLTTLGSHTGEMCGRDRAMLFEDPDGTTVLFDAGRTVMGPDDPRLPKTLNVVLVSSVHGDHQGDRRIPELNAGTCKKPKTNVKTIPNSNSVKIAAGKKSNIVAAGQMRAYLTPRMIAEGLDAKTVKKLVKRLRPGGKMKFGGVTVSAIPTVHANGASTAFVIDKELAAAMKKSGSRMPDQAFATAGLASDLRNFDPNDSNIVNAWPSEEGNRHFRIGVGCQIYTIWATLEYSDPEFQ